MVDFRESLKCYSEVQSEFLSVSPTKKKKKKEILTKNNYSASALQTKMKNSLNSGCLKGVYLSKPFIWGEKKYTKKKNHELFLPDKFSCLIKSISDMQKDEIYQA